MLKDLSFLLRGNVAAARHPGYAISQMIRKRIEEIFGWTKDGWTHPEGPAPRDRVRACSSLQLALA